MSKFAKLIGVAFLLSGPTWAASDTKATPTPTPIPAAVQADNTEINTRDKNDSTQTPQKQTTNKQDNEVLAAVRRAVVDDESLSMLAHNVKIVNKNGVVTLRGPVESASEKKKVEELAKQVKGVKRVVNQLDINTK